jgi:tRNA A37 threonylcarbamoyladenosine synthetase subunit TsaC/SUA5/YrdC
MIDRHLSKPAITVPRRSTPFIQVDAQSPNPEHIAFAAEALRRGEVLAFPTDTVYGLGLVVSSRTTPERLYALKRRDPDKAIALLVGLGDAKEQPLCVAPAAASAPESPACAVLNRWTEDRPDYALRLAERHWPGPLTLVLRASPMVPPAWQATDGSVALRVPASPVVLALLNALDAPLAATSANLQGQPPATRANEIDSAIVSELALVLDAGAVALGVASTVVSCLGVEPQVLRPGALNSASLW